MAASSDKDGNMPSLEQTAQPGSASDQENAMMLNDETQHGLTQNTQMATLQPEVDEQTSETFSTQPPVCVTAFAADQMPSKSSFSPSSNEALLVDASTPAACFASPPTAHSGEAAKAIPALDSCSSSKAPSEAASHQVSHHSSGSQHSDKLLVYSKEQMLAIGKFPSSQQRPPNLPSFFIRYFLPATRHL